MITQHDIAEIIRLELAIIANQKAVSNVSMVFLDEAVNKHMSEMADQLEQEYYYGTGAGTDANGSPVASAYHPEMSKMSYQVPQECDDDKHSWVQAAQYSSWAPADREVCTTCMAYRTATNPGCEHEWETKWLFSSSYKQCKKCKEESK